jgi:hypothetical protein
MLTLASAGTGSSRWSRTFRFGRFVLALARGYREDWRNTVVDGLAPVRNISPMS